MLVSLKVNKSAPRLHCRFVRGTSQLVRKSFTTLIVPYNSVYYNYIIITQWLVGWFEDQGKKGVCVGKKGVCVGKKVHGGPVYQLLLSTDS